MAQSPFVGCRIPQEWKERLDEIAESSGRSQSDILKDAIAQYLGEEVNVDIRSEIFEMKSMLSNLSNQFDQLTKRVEHLEGDI